jgi:hypothetical protein
MFDLGCPLIEPDMTLWADIMRNWVILDNEIVLINIARHTTVCVCVCVCGYILHTMSFILWLCHYTTCFGAAEPSSGTCINVKTKILNHDHISATPRTVQQAAKPLATRSDSIWFSSLRICNEIYPADPNMFLQKSPSLRKNYKHLHCQHKFPKHTTVLLQSFWLPS